MKLQSLVGEVALVIMVCTVPKIVFADLSAGLVLHYEFEGSADDSSANRYDGMVYGATLTTDRFGNLDSAYHFDGMDDYIDMNTSLGGYSAFSEFAWVRIDSLESGNNFIQSSNWYQNDTLGNDGGFDLAITNGYIRSWVNQPDRTGGSVLAGPYIDLNEWFLVGFTWDGSTHRLYLDGVEVASATYTGEMGTSDKTSLIGAKHYGLGLTDFFNGDVDDLRVYERALTNSEIHDLSVVPLPAAALLGILGLGIAASRLRRGDSDKMKGETPDSAL